jgi:hypothetical protein
MAHDSLSETVEAMLQMCRLPTWARKPLWQLFVLVVTPAVSVATTVL